MDINDIRTALTVLGFIGFSGIVIWAYGRTAGPGFEVAQALPFADEAAADDEGER